MIYNRTRMQQACSLQQPKHMEEDAYSERQKVDDRPTCQNKFKKNVKIYLDFISLCTRALDRELGEQIQDPKALYEWSQGDTECHKGYEHHNSPLK